MTKEEYWEGDSELTLFYLRKHKLDVKQKNQELWMQGAYFYNAISTALSNMHFDGKSHKLNSYLEEPFRIFPLTKEEEKEQFIKETKQVQDNLNRWLTLWKQKEANENG